MSATESVFDVIELSKSYDKTPALRNVSLQVPRGELVVIAGESGSGKSTLLHCLSGLERPSGGSIISDGVDLTSLKERKLAKWRREKTGIMSQSPNLLGAMTVAENLSIARTAIRQPVDLELAGTLVEELGISDTLRKLPGELSGGQQQRVALARTLVHNPEIIFADEPTAALDSTNRQIVYEGFRKVVDSLGRTVIMVTHDEYALSGYADKIIYLADGQLVDTPTGVIEREPLTF